MGPFRGLVQLLGGKSFLRNGLTRQYKRDLEVFLASGQKIKFNAEMEPEVSVIIPVFNSAYHTFRCLKSLATDLSVSLEIIIFDNASTDATTDLLRHFENISVIRHPHNIGFVKAVNLASRHARGRYILLLNNDATIVSGHLRDATEVFEMDSKVGAVGVRVKLATGQVQEAGSIIFRDGTTDGYLRNRNSDHFTGMFMRDVDFCSGVFLLLERLQFLDMGGLDEAFAPAYYEETDLCMRLRSQGLRVIYNPSIVIEHFEFGSQPSAAAFASISERRPVFLKKWRETLLSEGYCSANASHEVASRRLVSRPRLLVVLKYGLPEDIPHSIQSAIGQAVARKWNVSLFISGLQKVSWEKFQALFGNRVELIVNRGPADLARLLNERRNYFDIVVAMGADSPRVFERLRKSKPDFQGESALVSCPHGGELVKVLDEHETSNAV